ncbi:MAG: hypothetical protein RLZZ550_44, partial [Verrucomicrobiota bacterium]
PGGRKIDAEIDGGAEQQIVRGGGGGRGQAKENMPESRDELEGVFLREDEVDPIKGKRASRRDFGAPA